MPNSPENREELKTKSPLLRDVVLKTAAHYKRTVPRDIKTIELGVFSEEAAKMRKMCHESTNSVGSNLIINHVTGKLFLSEPKLAINDSFSLGLNITIDLWNMTSPRTIRQDKSVGMSIAAITREKDPVAHVARLLIEEKNPISPTAVMIISEEGSHLLFRTQRAIEQTEEENMKLIVRAKGITMGNFANQFHLAHFYCPSQSTVATPVLI